jgi:hypothetical protein
MNKVIATEHLIKLRNDARNSLEELKDAPIAINKKLNKDFLKKYKAKGAIEMLNKILEK